MLAEIEKVEGGYIARFDRRLKHSVEKVWAALTQNDKLAKWFPNLQVEALHEGGTIRFNFNDGTGSSFVIKITDFQENTILEFEWGEGSARFELYPQSEGCLLVLKEFIPALNNHTPKDLAGWHVCFDVLNSLLDGQFIEFPVSEWEKLYQEYMVAVDRTEK